MFYFFTLALFPHTFRTKLLCGVPWESEMFVCMLLHIMHKQNTTAWIEGQHLEIRKI